MSPSRNAPRVKDCGLIAENSKSCRSVKMKVGSDASSAVRSPRSARLQTEERRMIKLYDFPMSPRARKARIVLAEKGLQHEKVTLTSPKATKKNPSIWRSTPTERFQRFRMTASVCTSPPSSWSTSTTNTQIPPLLPADPGQRARARVLMHYGDNPYDGALGAIVGQVFFKPKGQADQEVIAKAKQDLNACFERLERELGNGDYLLGPSFTLADICFVTWAPLFGPLQVEIPSHCSRVQAWFKRMQERASVKTAG